MTKSELIHRIAEQNSHLTHREVEVLRLVSGGKTNKEIGFELYISPKTVDTHISSILGKIGAANRAEATAYAFRSGLVEA